MYPVLCPSSDGAAGALMRPMCLEARHCPQLKRSVCAIVEPSEELLEKLGEER